MYPLGSGLKGSGEGLALAGVSDSNGLRRLDSYNAQ
jgi:hypothetical protein